MAITSKKYKYIGITPYKTGTNSLYKIMPSAENVIGLHCNAIDMKKHCYSQGMKDFWDNAVKFGVIRNPFDWLPSLYFYILRANGHNENTHMKSKNYWQFLNWLVFDAMKRNRPQGSNKYLTLKGFVCDEDGNVMVNHIVRTETLQHDMAKVCKDIGIPLLNIPHANRNVNAAYKELYDKDERCRPFIEEHFAEDFEKFDYKFPY